MAITLKRQLTEQEKAEIINRFDRKCFATGHRVPDGEPIHFDHIRAFSCGGPSSLDNIAPMCEKHNKQKGRLPLEDFRIKLRLEDFFTTGDKLTLRHFLKYLSDESNIDGYAEPLAIQCVDGKVVMESADEKKEFPVSKCPVTNASYFYAHVPVSWLDSDDDEDESIIGLQPRYLIFDKVFRLYRHFQNNTVLQPSIGRIVNNKHLRMFDGQHKIASLLLTGRKSFDCKIFVNHDVRLLNQTNIAAHDKFAQTRFFSSIMVLKLGSQFGNDFEKYKNIEDGKVKSESGFMDFLEKENNFTLTKGELNKRFRSYLFNSILEDEDNKLSCFVSSGNRSSSEKPLTIDMLNKSLLTCFLYRKPVEDNMTTSAYKREFEISNVVSLMNMLYDQALCNWDPNAGPNDNDQIKLDRMFRSKSIMAWSELLRDAVIASLGLMDAEDREQPFYREINEVDMTRMGKVVGRLVSWSMWSSPKGSDIDRVLADNKKEVKKWLKEKGLTTGYLLGAPE